MSDRNTAILEAAGRVFARYGVGKTTMGDIATEAGVARQTVYNAYQNKDDLLRAVVRKSALSTEETTVAAWRDLDSFEDKLDVFFAEAPLAWYDLVAQAPDAAELIEGVHRIANVEMDEAAARWRAYFKEVIESHFDTSKLDVPALADFIHSSAINAKHGVADRSELESRLRLLKQSITAMLAPAAK